MMITLKRIFGRKDMDPSEVDRLIRRNASEAAYLKYQEAIGSQIRYDVAQRVEEYADGFARTGDMTADHGKESGVVDALNELAGIIKTSTLPSGLVRIDGKEPDVRRPQGR